MQTFTKAEISWMADKFDKLAKSLGQRFKETPNGVLTKLYQLRSEQYADISRRLRIALEEGDKRIEIR